MAMALTFPPVPREFLELFPGATEHSIVWENPALGLFGVIVPPPGTSAPQQCALPEGVPPSPTVRDAVVEVETDLTIPVIPPEQRSNADGATPLCNHGVPTAQRTVVRSAANMGRGYYTCASGRSCGFFRWSEDADQYSQTRIRPPMTADEVRQETHDIDVQKQLQAWAGVRQGTEEWHRLRACRVTASNFGTVNRTNSYSKPEDLLRGILWPMSYDSVAMRYGSVNEKAAFERFGEFLTQHADHPDLPIFVDEPGIWVSALYPYLGGSPDGICYETLDAIPVASGGGTYYRCRRSLLEIKTPYKLRTRLHGGDFYPPHRQRNGQKNNIPGSYYDQVMGNCFLMGCGQAIVRMHCMRFPSGLCGRLPVRGLVYFVCLSPTGYHVQAVDYDPVYVTQQLLPSLVDFWHNMVVPAFEQRDRMGMDGVQFGWIPEHIAAAAAKRKADNTSAADSGQEPQQQRPFVPPPRVVT